MSIGAIRIHLIIGTIAKKSAQIRTLFFEVLEIMCIFAQMKNDEVLSRPI